MLKRDRVKTAIKQSQTDIVPYNIELTSEELTKVTDYIGIDKSSFDDYVGNHFEKANFNMGGKYIKPGFFRDEFGVVWDRSGRDRDIGIISDLLIPEANLDDFTFPKPDLDLVREKTKKLVSNGQDTFKFGKIGMTYFERAWSFRGMQNLLMDFHLNPLFVHELFNRILDYNLQIIDAALEYNIDGFYFGDDYGQQNGLIMNPETWREFIKPGLARMFETVKNKDRIVALHSCGNISDILTDLIDIGLDIYQTVQPEIYNLQKLKSNYGKYLTFWGGISTQRDLPFCTPEELKSVVKKTIEIMSDGGGYIAAPTHRVPFDVPAENLVALIEVFKGQ